MAVKGLIASIVQFLTQQLEDGDILEDSQESLEVVIQCLESAYNVQASDAPANFNLYEVYKSAIENAKPQLAPEATPEAKAEAEKLKNEGNALMKAEKHSEAVVHYTKAIQLDSRNAVYYCNRAAAYSKIGNHQQAIKDGQTALSIDPSYSKAYGRLGLAYSSLNKHKEAKEAYQKALQMEPDNESYKNNLQLAEEKLAQQSMNNIGLGGSGMPNVDVTSLLSNPAFMNMARQMLSNSDLQNFVGNLASGQVEQRGLLLDHLLEAGQHFARYLQNANPELIETLRQQMGNNDDQDPPQQS